MKINLNKILIFYSLIFFIVFLFLPEKIQAWTESTASPPGGNIGPPINVSETSQTKIGNLTVGLDANRGTPNENIFSIWGQICLNTSGCLSRWEAGNVGFVHLFKAPIDWGNFQPGLQADQGFAYVMAQNEKQKAAIYGEGFTPTATSGFSAGVYGVSGSNNPKGMEIAGIYGRANASEGNIIGIYGAVAPGVTNAYAGYFAGKVGIANKFQINLDPSDPVNTGNLCLSGESPLTACRNQWNPEIIDPYWGISYSNNYTKKLVYSRNLVDGVSHNIVLGDYVFSGKNTFFVDYDSGAMIIGDPLEYLPPDLPVSYTCGDGLCNGSETNFSCPGDCPLDWAICNVNITPVGNRKVRIGWRTNCSSYKAQKTTGIVEYGLSTDYGEIKTDPILSTSHSVELTDLDLQNVYHCRIRAQDTGGNEVYSSDFIFGGASDTTKPTITIQSPTNNQSFPWDTLGLNASGTCSDGGDGNGIQKIEVVVISVQGFPYYSNNYETSCNSLSWNQTVTFALTVKDRDGNLITLRRYGAYVIQAWAYDPSGNWSLASVMVNWDQCEADSDCKDETKFPGQNYQHCWVDNNKICVQCFDDSDCDPNGNLKYCGGENNNCVECRGIKEDCDDLYHGAKPICCSSGLCASQKRMCPVTL